MYQVLTFNMKKGNGAKVGAVREPPLPKTALTPQPPLPTVGEGEIAAIFSPLSQEPSLSLDHQGLGEGGWGGEGFRTGPLLRHCVKTLFFLKARLSQACSDPDRDMLWCGLGEDWR